MTPALPGVRVTKPTLGAAPGKTSRRLERPVVVGARV